MTFEALPGLASPNIAELLSSFVQRDKNLFINSKNCTSKPKVTVLSLTDLHFKSLPKTHLYKAAFNTLFR